MSAVSPPLVASLAELARRALANIGREYPNHPQYLLTEDADAVPPRVLHPVFFGCFDWHSAVHTHWLLVRLVNTDPALELRQEIVAELTRSFEPAKLAVEAEYLRKRPAFERPYGIAWLALLEAEIRASGEPAARGWAHALGPLAAVGRDNVRRWLAGLRYPVRSGTHDQTAFALTLLFDAARDTGDTALLGLVRNTTIELYGADTDAPLRFEPSGEDFLSPALMEADLMRRVLAPADFAAWLTRFLPGIPERTDAAWLPCAEVRDEADGKLVHLHGLNLSRAWNLHNLAAALPPSDRRAGVLHDAADRHEAEGLGATLGMQHYAGDHWLPTFAGYLLNARGLTAPGREQYSS